MAISTYIFTMAQILQTAFIIAIIVEIFKLFGSFKGKGRDVARNDSYTFKLKNLIGGSEDKINKNDSEGERDHVKVDDESDDEDKIEEEIVNISISGNTHIEILFNGIVHITNVIQDPNVNSTLIYQLRTQVVEKMLVSISNIRKLISSRKTLTTKHKNSIIKAKKFIKHEVLIFEQSIKELKKEIKSVESRLGHCVICINALKAKLAVRIKYFESIIQLSNIMVEAVNVIEKRDSELVIIEERTDVEVKRTESELKEVMKSLERLEDKSIKHEDASSIKASVVNKSVSLKKSIEHIKHVWESEINYSNESLFKLRREKVDKPHRDIGKLIKEQNAELVSVENKFRHEKHDFKGESFDGGTYKGGTFKGGTA